MQQTQLRVHTYLGTNPKKIDSLLAQVICPKFMAVMVNPWCLQDCHYLNNLACALRTLFGFLDRNVKNKLGLNWLLRGGVHKSWELALGEYVSTFWFWISRRQLIITYLLSKNLVFCLFYFCGLVLAGRFYVVEIVWLDELHTTIKLFDFAITPRMVRRLVKLQV